MIVADLRKLASQTMPGFPRDTANAAADRIVALEQALHRVNPFCMHLSHRKGEFHSSGEPCPVEAILAAALKEPS